jgi:uncharacterized heparinase superfamily protein
MSPGEIVYRLRQWITLEQEWIQWRRGYQPQPKLNTKDIFKCFRFGQDVHFFFHVDQKNAIAKTIRRDFPDGYDVTLEKADGLCQHKIEIYGYTFDLGDTIDWSRDPLTDRSWPRTFAGNIDIRNSKNIRGVKWVWELNRHHHLVTLAKAYFLTGEELYAEEVCTQITNWIETNPPLTGVNWTSSLELAVRLINWSWAMAFIRDADSLTQGRFAQIQTSITNQATYISKHLSSFSSANNHLIGEAAGLAIVGMCNPWLPKARSWRDKGLHILKEEIGRQIHSDGVPAEQSTHYLAFIIDFNLIVWELFKKNNIDPPQLWYDRLLSSCNFIRNIMDSNGNVPQIGDSDDAWVVRLDDSPQVNNFKSILTTAATLLRQPSLKPPNQHWDEKSFWLLGWDGHETYSRLPITTDQHGSHIFAHGGYGVLQTENNLAVFDCGPLGYLSTAAHGHADALNFLLSRGGQPLLVDPGTYLYQEGGQWREFFRSTYAHNTVVVDGLDQSQMLGTFLWGKKANVHIENWNQIAKNMFIAAEHDGYAHLGVIHSRKVIYFDPDVFIIIDEFRAINPQKVQTTHTFEQLWHLSPKSLAIPSAEGVNITVEDHKFFLIPLDLPPYQLKVQIGEDGPPQGWISNQYGHLELAPVINITVLHTLPVTMATGIFLSHNKEFGIKDTSHWPAPLKQKLKEVFG